MDSRPHLVPPARTGVGVGRVLAVVVIAALAVVAPGCSLFDDDESDPLASCESEVNETIQPDVGAVVSEIGGHMGYEPWRPVRVQRAFVTRLELRSEDPFADSGSARCVEGEWRFSDASSADACLIRLAQRSRDWSRTRRRFTLLHEAFHCWQWGATLSTEGCTRPDWIKEGGAHWVAQKLAPDSSHAADWWDEYFRNEKPLWEPSQPEPACYRVGIQARERTYDAMGLFAHLDSYGMDVWTLLHDLNHTSSNAEAFGWIRRAAANNPQLLQNWASGLLRDQDRAWTIRAPGIGSVSARREPLTAEVKPNRPYDSTPLGGVNQRIVELSVDQSRAEGQVLEVTVHGYGRIRWLSPSRPTPDETFSAPSGWSKRWQIPGGGTNAGRGVPELPSPDFLIAATGDEQQALRIEARIPCDPEGRWRSTGAYQRTPETGPPPPPLTGGRGVILVLRRDGTYRIDYSQASDAAAGAIGALRGLGTAIGRWKADPRLRTDVATPTVIGGQPVPAREYPFTGGMIHPTNVQWLVPPHRRPPFSHGFQHSTPVLYQCEENMLRTSQEGQIYGFEFRRAP